MPPTRTSRRTSNNNVTPASCKSSAENANASYASISVKNSQTRGTTKAASAKNSQEKNASPAVLLKNRGAIGQRKTLQPGSLKTKSSSDGKNDIKSSDKGKSNKDVSTVGDKCSNLERKNKCVVPHAADRKISKTSPDPMLEKKAFPASNRCMKRKLVQNDDFPYKKSKQNSAENGVDKKKQDSKSNGGKSSTSRSKASTTVSAKHPHNRLKHVLGHKLPKEEVSRKVKESVSSPENMRDLSPSNNSQGMVELMTDDSSSDTDFEVVQTQFRTQESLATSISLSDSSVNRKLKDSFPDQEQSQSDKDSIAQETSGSRKPTKLTISSNPVKKKSLSSSSVDRRRVSCEKSMASQKHKSLKEKTSSSHKSQSKASSSRGRTASSTCTSSKPSKNERRKSKKASLSPKKEKIQTTNKVDENDVMAILLKMEGQAEQASPVKQRGQGANKPSTSGSAALKKKRPGKKMHSAGALLHSDSDGESDWEEVEDYKHGLMKSQIPEDPVQITIHDPTLVRKKKKKKEFDWKAYVQRKIKRLAKEIQVDMHKVHLLCLLSLGMQQSRVCSNPTLAAIALSTIPAVHLEKSVAQYTSRELFVFLRWFRSAFCLAKSSETMDFSLVGFSKMALVLSEIMAGDARLLVMALVVLLRAMGFHVRLVISLDPLPLKNSKAAGPSKSGAKRTKEKNSEENDAIRSKTSKTTSNKSSKDSGSAKKSATQSSKSSTSSKTNQTSKSKQQTQQIKKRRFSSGKRSKKCDSSTTSSDDDKPSPSKKRRSTRPATNKKQINTSRVDSSDETAGGKDKADLSGFSDSGSNFSDDDLIREKKKKKNRDSTSGKGKGKMSLSSLEGHSIEEDSREEFEESFSVRSLVMDKVLKKASRKILSSDSSPEGTSSSKSKSGRNYWLEVFLPNERKWICVDCVRIALGKPYDISAAASQPLLYVLAFDNDRKVKDVTAKYAPQWLSHTRKQRVDSAWWMDTLEPYAPVNERLDEEENDGIRAQLMQRPLPTSIGEYKNHPLYALQRHLLRYEAIYPENSIPVGYIRHEPVYARESIHTLHSRDNWLREARVVRLGETAYKRVKSRKRWNKPLDNPEELDLELFGRWQTEDYIPPPAVDGKVPKNEYGNVELFQPSMLPGGTVHVRVPALNRVAKKLGIDIAAAMTGWDHHCGFSHPVLDGWIVCEEHKDVLLAAWEEDQEIQRQRDEERREKRVLSNWTTLVRGLLIKERLKKTFNLQEKKPHQKSKKAALVKEGEVATDVQHAWPAKQQDQQKKRGKTKPAPQPSHYTVETM